jgi:hypothetical protein
MERLSRVASERSAGRREKETSLLDDVTNAKRSWDSLTRSVGRRIWKYERREGRDEFGRGNSQ